jgi:hypothetical protein
MAYNEYPAGEIEVRGTKYPVTVSDHGIWSTDYNSTRLAGSTKEDLRIQLMSLTKRAAAKVEVRFSVLATRKYAPRGELYNRLGTATGLHSANGNILVRWDDDTKADQISERYTSEYFTPPLGEAEAGELIALREAEIAARNAVSQFGKAHGITRLHDAVVKAIETAVAADDSQGGE